MSDIFEKVLEKKENKGLKTFYESLIKAIDDKSGFEVVANQIKAFQEKVDGLVENLEDKDRTEDLKALYLLQEKVQEATLQTNTGVLKSLQDIIKNLVVSLEHTQEASKTQVKEITTVVNTMSEHLTKQYEMMMLKAEQDKNAEWEFTTEEVQDNIIRKVKIKRIR